ncbi:MAG: WD40 repeat domain-containing protein, partial [Myxococcales bacterium]|nr:WD40 repeat domain-containing protein [Myxococcales bacterium]
FDDRGEWLAAALGEQGEILLWSMAEIADGRLAPMVVGIHGENGKSAGAFSVAFGPRRLASTGNDGRVVLWPLPGSSGEPWEFEGHQGRATHLAYSDDHRRLAVVFSDHIMVWTLDEDGLPATEPVKLPHGTYLHGFVFDRSGRFLVSVGADSQAYFWDLERPETSVRYPAATGEARAVRFIFDDRYFAVLSGDATGRLWPSQSSVQPASNEAMVLAVDPQPIYLATAHDGRTILVGSRGDPIRLLRLVDSFELEPLAARLRAATDYCLTVDERMRLLGELRGAAEEAARVCNEQVGAPPLFRPGAHDHSHDRK